MTTQGFAVSHLRDAHVKSGSCVHQPRLIRHREIGHSGDVEPLETVMPADFATEEVAAV